MRWVMNQVAPALAAATRSRTSFGSRHLGFDAYWAAGENGYLVDESILPQFPPRLGGEKQGESRVSQAIAALPASIAGRGPPVCYAKVSTRALALRGEGTTGAALPAAASATTDPPPF
ncbi:hypothetical protein G6F65_020917 [Rhizopus arrhizus]|nr:hypothetical protein G6F65_020917 [Rhizopus arrhizus]